MNEETAIERLSKPPPGYDAGPIGGLSAHGRAMSIASAWMDYKGHNDPPGMWSGKARGEHPGGYGFALMGTDPEHPLEADFEVLADARAAAWTWHGRRHEACSRLSKHGNHWPRLLSAGDEQMAELERWLDAWGEFAAPDKPRPLTGPKPSLPLPEVLRS